MFIAPLRTLIIEPHQATELRPSLEHHLRLLHQVFSDEDPHRAASEARQEVALERPKCLLS